jgi:vacuolar-type H+-ATPase subunit D/Vma8|tara:strand:+ start:198 stop:482 length:285 start_codon:yes stop_codon:yes gene_type:complete
MAKNKKKAVDLKPTKITDEELKRLQELVNLINRGELQIGNLESKKHGLLHQVIAVQEQMKQLQQEFQETYGNVDINITDGTINYTEDEQADKKN